MKGVVDGQCFVKGSWGAAIIDELAPQQGDIVIEGKRGLDTFASTNLDFILVVKALQRSLSAAFPPIVASSRRCEPATSLERHDNAIAYEFPMFSLPAMSGDFIGEFGE